MFALVAARQQVTWAEARDQLSADDPARGDAVVEWAIARGHFVVDLDRPITSRTLLTPLAAASPAATIRI